MKRSYCIATFILLITAFPILASEKDMPDKYIIQNAAFNGDGTTKAPATVDGGVGAWNDILPVLQGTPAHGSIAAGDDVYVKTHNGTNNLSVNWTNTITSMAGTENAPVNFYFDDGTDWGDSGIFEFSYNSNGQLLILKDFVNLISRSGKRIDFKFTSTAWKTIPMLRTNNNTIVGYRAYRDTNAISSNATFVFHELEAAYKVTHLINGEVKPQSTFDSSAYPLFKSYNSSGFHIDGLTIDTTELTAISGVRKIYAFRFEAYSKHQINNVCWKGDNEHCYIYYDSAGYNNDVSFHSFASENDLLQHGEGTSNTHSYNDIRFTYADGNFDFREDNGLSIREWRAGQNYPVLNAQLPDNTGYSVKVYPHRVKPGKPGLATTMNKYFDQVSSNKTITSELLINASYGTPLNRDWYMTVSYSDPTGTLHTEVTPMDNGSLPTSTASWDKTSYGAQSYNRHKLSITTKNSVKQNSMLIINVFSTKPAISSSDFYFVDPDPQIV